MKYAPGLRRPVLWSLVFTASLALPAAAAPIKVAVIGPQHVHSHQLTRDKEFPAMLQVLLGPNYVVGNFGDCCASILRGYPRQSETHPYLEGGESYPAVGGMNFHDSIKFMPDIVLIAPFGKHDRELSMQMFGGKLDLAKETTDYEALVTTYLNLPQKPKVYVSTPIPIPYGSPESVVTQVMLPAAKAVIEKYHLPYVDFHEKFLNHKELFKDDTHLTNDTGLHLLADSFFALMKQQDGESDGGVSGSGGSGGGTDAGAPEPADAAATPEPADAPVAVDAPASADGGKSGGSAKGGASGSGTGSGGNGGGKSGSTGKGGSMAETPDEGDGQSGSGSSGCALGGGGPFTPAGPALLLGLLALGRSRRRR